MIQTIAKKELQSLIRDGRFLVTAVVIIVLLVLSIILSFQTLQLTNQERLKAQAASRQNWLNQTPKNPHKAAHFGNFVYRLKTPLSIFDNGLDSYTGTSVYLEPHKSDDFQFSQAEDATSLLRFGELTPAFVLQTILPLLLIFLCFNAISKEREDSTLKLLLGQGASIRQIALGKIIGYSAAIWMLLLPVFFLIALILPGQIHTSVVDIWLRFALLIISYGAYTFFIILVCVVISAYSLSSRAALIKLLSLWIFACILLPKLAGNAGSFFYKTPSQYAYAGLVKHDEENGLNGHDPHDKRREVLLKAQLKKYHVDSANALPVNFDAIAMVESEKYTTSVYRKRIGEVRTIFNSQNQFTRFAAFINPFLAVQATSMTLCGTDYLQFTHFQDNAENYRLYFVNVMNEYMAVHTKSGDWTTPFGRNVFQSIKPFNYREPVLSSIVGQELPGLLAMVFWLLVCTMLIFTLNPEIQ